jgi:hypothetical protein
MGKEVLLTGKPSLLLLQITKLVGYEANTARGQKHGQKKPTSPPAEYQLVNKTHLSSLSEVYFRYPAATSHQHRSATLGLRRCN